MKEKISSSDSETESESPRWPNLPPRPKKKGLTSRFLNQKTNAEKEIEEWADMHVKNDNLSRMSGQLPDNVTEERMLRSKKIELSKERHKFFAHKEYEKNLFIENSKRRKKILAGSADRRAARERRKSDSGQGTAAINDLAASMEKSKEINKQTNEHDKGKRVDTMPKIRTNQQHQYHPTNKPIFKTQPLENEDHLPELMRSVTFAADTKPPLRGARPAFLRKNTNVAAPIETEQPKEDLSIKKQSDSTRKSSIKPPAKPTCTSDARYKMLEKSLSELHCIDKPEDVNHIITRIAALHIQSKCPKDRKPKLANQIQDFMRKRGIAF